MTNRMLLGLATVVILFAGCGDEGPPTVRYGHENCAHCRMIINDARFAAALATDGGDVLKFDEVSCLVDYLSDNPNSAKTLWVRGYRSDQWHDARQAFYVHGPKLQTPMGSGLAAAATQVEADNLARELDGKVLNFADLASFLRPTANR